MLGIALGVAALIIVLSEAMNGFQKEVRDRTMLSVVSHVEIFAPQGTPLPDMERLGEARRLLGGGAPRPLSRRRPYWRVART